MKTLTLFIFVIAAFLCSCTKESEISQDYSMKEKVPDTFFLEISYPSELDREMLVQGYAKTFEKYGKVVFLHSREELLKQKNGNGSASGSFSILSLWQGDPTTFEKKLNVLKINLIVNFYLGNTHRIPKLSWDESQYIGIEDKETSTKRALQSIDEMLMHYISKYKCIRKPLIEPIFYLSSFAEMNNEKTQP